MPSAILPPDSVQSGQITNGFPLNISSHSYDSCRCHLRNSGYFQSPEHLLITLTTLFLWKNMFWVLNKWLPSRVLDHSHVVIWGVRDRLGRTGWGRGLHTNSNAHMVLWKAEAFPILLNSGIIRLHKDPWRQCLLNNNDKIATIYQVLHEVLCPVQTVLRALKFQPFNNPQTRISRSTLHRWETWSSRTL